MIIRIIQTSSQWHWPMSGCHLDSTALDSASRTGRWLQRFPQMQNRSRLDCALCLPQGEPWAGAALPVSSWEGDERSRAPSCCQPVTRLFNKQLFCLLNALCPQ